MIDSLLQYDDFRLILVVSIAFVLVMVMSLGMHEFAHAFVAYKNGDDTAKLMGRLTINPFAHMDPIGFLCLFFFDFGWAKPVPINPIKFRKYRKGLILTSLAGVTANLMLAIVGGLCYILFIKFSANITNIYVFAFLHNFCYYLFYINICLMVFNLLPIPPLDGFNFISTLTKYDNKFIQFMQRYGTLILIAVLLFAGDFLQMLMDWVSLPILWLWSWILFL
ncbi:MAG: site-2 protease family protein [Clostridia bacterium]|nr:site-2 protease family protein [Clostridia bacterium]